MVLANNAANSGSRLREVQTNILSDHTIINNVHQVSTLRQVFKKHYIQIKEAY